MCSLLGACASTPSQRIDRIAAEYGFQRKVVTGTEFQHIVYLRRSASPTDPLHVYLEGDGSPWIREHWVSSDPTPRNPLALRLMATDPSPSVYVGRPCYHGFADHPPCEPVLWTSARYSERVVSSMQSVVGKLLRDQQMAGIVFIGYSGGGTLAMLLAERFPQTTGVITIAGNLDIHAWTAHHRYSPLQTSLNPKDRSPLPEKVAQLHLLGKNDRIVPPYLTRSAIAISGQPHAVIEVVEKFDHICCWLEAWPEILTKFDRIGQSAQTPATKASVKHCCQNSMRPPSINR